MFYKMSLLKNGEAKLGYEQAGMQRHVFSIIRFTSFQLLIQYIVNQ